jgi:hypothetical protein
MYGPSFKSVRRGIFLSEARLPKAACLRVQTMGNFGASLKLHVETARQAGRLRPTNTRQVTQATFVPPSGNSTPPSPTQKTKKRSG